MLKGPGKKLGERRDNEAGETAPFIWTGTSNPNHITNGLSCVDQIMRTWSRLRNFTRRLLTQTLRQ